MKKEDIADILISDEREREERIHELLKARKSLNINKEHSNRLTTGEKLADRLACFAGSWSFIIFFGIVVVGWAIVNSPLIMADPLDPFPYVFLNLILACIASVQAPIIMMSQNREAQKDRLRAENEYLINLKSEIILEDLHMKIDDIIRTQNELKNELERFKISSNGHKEYKGLRSGANEESDTGSKESGLHH